jgi:hypothetical protein
VREHSGTVGKTEDPKALARLVFPQNCSDEPKNAVILPRGMTREQAATYCGCESMAAFSNWVRRGIVPGPPGTHRWDRRAIDAALDRASGLENRLQQSPLEAWRARRARSSEGHP